GLDLAAEVRDHERRPVVDAEHRRSERDLDSHRSPSVDHPARRLGMDAAVDLELAGGADAIEQLAHAADLRQRAHDEVSSSIVAGVAGFNASPTRFPIVSSVR